MEIQQLREPVSNLTVLSTVYHSQPGEDPSMCEAKFSAPLESNEQPYVRKKTVGNAWEKLDCGWLQEASLVVIINTEGTNLQTRPSEEESAEIASRVIHLRYSGSDCHWEIPPKKFFLGAPSDVDLLEIRCAKGSAKVHIHVFPR